jgi:F0F1-type ATP synthase assembly protein I
MDRRLLALRLLGLGWYVAACVVVGAVGGVWVDRLSGLTPLFTLLGVLIGTVAAFYGLYKMVLPLFNNASSSGNSGSEGEDSQ